MVDYNRINRIRDPEDRVLEALKITTKQAGAQLGPDLKCEPVPDSHGDRLLWSIYHALGKRIETSQKADVSWGLLETWFEIEGIRRLFVMRAQTLRDDAIDRLYECVGKYRAEIWLVDSSKNAAQRNWDARWRVTHWHLDSFRNRQREVVQSRALEKKYREPSSYLKWQISKKARDASAFGFFDALAGSSWTNEVQQAISYFRGGGPLPPNYRRKKRVIQPSFDELLLRRVYCALAVSDSREQKLCRWRSAQLVAFQEGWYLEGPSLDVLPIRNLSSQEVARIRRLSNPEDALIGMIAVTLGLESTDIAAIRSTDGGEVGPIELYGLHILWEGGPLFEYVSVFRRWEDIQAKTIGNRLPAANSVDAGDPVFRQGSISWNRVDPHVGGRSPVSILASLERFANDTGIDPFGSSDTWKESLMLVPLS